MKCIYNNYETNTQTLIKYGFFKKLDYYTQNPKALERLFKKIDRYQKILKLKNKLKNHIGGIKI